MTAFQLTLFHFLTNSFILHDAYQCPTNLTTIRFERPVLGSFFLFFGMFFIALYIPCFLAISLKVSRAPVYQIMFSLALFDISSLSVNSVASGIFDIYGISFCNYPILIFCLGVVASGSWLSGCVSCILLAIERCVEINPEFPLEFLFHKSVFPFLRFIMIFYSAYTYFLTRPALFLSEYSCWVFDPLIGKDPNLYFTWPHTINNIVVGTTTTLLYLYISYRLIFKFGYSTSMWLYKTKRQILFQAISLCFFHTAAGFLYVYMQFYPTTLFVIVSSQFIWQWSSGAVCVSYLIFNRTIRNMVLKMMIPKNVRKKYGLHIGVAEHIAAEEAAASVPVVVPNINAVRGSIKFDNYL